MTTKTVFRTPWGWIGIAASAQGVCAIVLPKPSRLEAERALRVQGVSSNGHLAPPDRLLRDAQTQVAAYLAGKRHTLDFPIDLSAGTSFQRRVWQTALRIPYGRARSYQWIASKVGGTRHARAVGNALGANPVPLIVPCHRVVAKDASLGGFSGGLVVKRKLLDLEGTLKQLGHKV
ncbi:MAG: methylated-DNA--[protein]-cysteine S-methyltransferase [Nitrospiraceae bacterium]|nr:methylated-DNA--[protein]-cysteine S-methyltransferase [Nitrospiraceae bacterium]